MNDNRRAGPPQEQATVYTIDGISTVGLYHPAPDEGSTGVLFVVGGRQYRTGAQRQFVRLARHLAANGYPAFRFDLRGMGDSAGEPLHFLDTAHDIATAVAEFRRLAPRLERILLWGLCDGASAAILYSSEHEGIDSVMMVNPWITTDSSAASTLFKHHYRKRLKSIDFWQDLMSGKVNVAKALSGLGKKFWQRVGAQACGVDDELNLAIIVFDAIERFTGQITVIVSQKDLTAVEFKDEYDRRLSVSGCNSIQNLTMFSVDADHTFSAPEQHVTLEELTLAWCKAQHV